MDSWGIPRYNDGQFYVGFHSQFGGVVKNCSKVPHLEVGLHGAATELWTGGRWPINSLDQLVRVKLGWGLNLVGIKELQLSFHPRTVIHHLPLLLLYFRVTIYHLIYFSIFLVEIIFDISFSMGQPSPKASNAIIYVTYALFLYVESCSMRCLLGLGDGTRLIWCSVSGCYIAWRLRHQTKVWTRSELASNSYSLWEKKLLIANCCRANFCPEIGLRQVRTPLAQALLWYRQVA